MSENIDIKSFARRKNSLKLCSQLISKWIQPKETQGPTILTTQQLHQLKHLLIK